MTQERSNKFLPEGTVTFLFSDIEGSTELLNQLGDDYAAVLSEQREILRTYFAKWNGQEVDTQGDAFFYSFTRAIEAVTATAEAQRAISTHDWPMGVEVRVRMGLHTGEPLLAKEGYVGIDVHRAARICHVGYGGQVLLSETTAPLVRDDLPQGVGLRDLGDHRLKDLRHPERVYQLVISGLHVDFPSLKSLDAHPNNLPIQSTNHIGREEELVSARNLLSRVEVRLLTITGPGGIGKTRLGLQLAAELSDEFNDGVFFVPLAPITDCMLVTSTVAQTLGIHDRGSQPILDTLIEHLRPHNTLLFLDNFEHVYEAASEVTRLLESCPLIKILVTSREVLRVRGEFEFLVRPLAVPDVSHRPTVDLLTRNPAVKLFSQRAQSVKPNFCITEENAVSVAEICTRLDGLPLAIELAAARVKLFPPKALLKQLIEANGHSSLHILARGPRDAPERHRTLRAAMDWSYELLDDNEQRLFQSLSVFAGGFTFTAVNAVCCYPVSNTEARSDKTQDMDVMEGLASLLDKSLLRQDGRLEDEPRFNMLELIRDYAGEKLSDSNREAKIRESHANFFLSLAEEARPNLKEQEQEMWLERLEKEHNNLRSALGWFIQLAELGTEASEDTATSGLRLAGALWRFWDTHGHIGEGRRWLRKILALSETPTIERVDTLTGAAYLARRQSDYAEGFQLYEQGLRIARDINYKTGIAKSLDGLGYLNDFQGADDELIEALYSESLELWREVGDKRGIATALGPQAHRTLAAHDFEHATVLFEESLALFREVHDKREIAGALWNLGQIAVVVGRYDKAKEMYDESLEIYKSLKDFHGVATQLRSLGEVERNQDNSIQARALYGEALESFRTLGDKRCSSIALAGLGRAALDQEDLSGATSLILECLSITREIGFRSIEAQALRLLGYCDLAQGDLKSAKNHFIESCRLKLELDHQEGIAENLEGFASLAVALAEYKRAIHLVSAAEALRVQLRTPLPPLDASDIEDWKAIARVELGNAAYESAKEEGSTLTVEQAVSLVLEGE
jgi:predicted ATPase/class 3 adenylate cyclase